MEEHITKINEMINEFYNHPEKEMFLTNSDIESIEILANGMDRLQEYEEYTQNMFKKNRELEKEIKHLKYELSKIDEEAKEFFEWYKELSNRCEEPEKLFISVYHEGIFKVFDYVRKSKVKEVVQKHFEEIEKDKEIFYTGTCEDKQDLIKQIEKEILEG